MNRVLGRYDTKELALVIDLSETDPEQKKLFADILKYYQDNMFINFRRQSAKLKRIVLSSVGDHLNDNDEQDAEKADLYLSIEIQEPLSDQLYAMVNAAANWLIHFQYFNSKNKLKNELYLLIRKSDGYILRPGDF